MKNAAGTENRFPRTVIEAVYGLSSYLQQQFASLADIYMPIEGISEALTGQEFVYRISPNTIKAKSLTLDKILGKTLAWNQLCPSLTSPFSHRQVTYTPNSDGSITINGTATGGTSECYFITNNYFASFGHKVLFLIKGNTNTEYLAYGNGFANLGISSSVSNIFQLSQDAYYLQLRVPNNKTASNEKVYFGVFDLTLMFGAGNEPSTVAEFEALYHLPYYPYNAGKLISNDASALETVGFNLCDITKLENSDNGSVVISSDNIVTLYRAYYAYYVYLRDDNIRDLPIGTALYFGGTVVSKTGTSYIPNLTLFHADGTFDRANIGGTTTITKPITQAAVYFAGGESGVEVKISNMIINLSDASRNGQYEPYWKRTLPLNLGGFKVKSPNIWDEEWEVGAIGTDGQPSSGNSYIRSKNFMSVEPSTAYYWKTSGSSATLFFYDADGTFINYTQGTAANTTSTTPANCRLMKFCVNNGGTYSNDITINKSDPAFNGRYFSHEDITITGGLKGIDSYRDEIIGNKFTRKYIRQNLGDLTWSKWTGQSTNTKNYRSTTLMSMTKVAISSQDTGGIVADNGYEPKSVGYFYETHQGKCIGIAGDGSLCVDTEVVNDATAAKTALNGVYADIPLRYPETYELVEPLVPTVKAGTTEARISPNAEGLSAPFRADMTYSAQENNDSASSQYAAVAGRLLNPQTIWGQTFDGSSPVTGALTGVTNINSKINFYATGIGIAGNATISGGLSVSGTTAFDDEVYMGSHTLYLDSAEENSIWYDEDDDIVKFGFSTYALFANGIKSNSFITAGAAASSSDARLKDNLTAIPQERALSILSAISGKEWDWNDKMTAFEGQHCSGLVAQEVQKVMPWAVLDYNDTLSLNYNCLWGIAIPVIQNLMHRVEELESKLKTN